MKRQTRNRIIDLVENRLPAHLRQDVETLCAKDADARALYEWTTQFQTWRKGIRFPKPSTTVTEQLVAAHAAKYGSQSTQTTWWQHLTAVLTFDSLNQSADLGGALALARSAGGGLESRQIAYTTPALDLVLDIHIGPSQQKTISGQLLPKLPEADAVFTVQLMHNDQDAGLTQTDEFGEFSLKTPVNGNIHLVLSNDAFEVWLPQLKLTV